MKSRKEIEGDREAEELLREMDELIPFTEANFHLVGTSIPEQDYLDLVTQPDSFRKACERVAECDRIRDAAHERQVALSQDFAAKWGEPALRQVTLEHETRKRAH